LSFISANISSVVIPSPVVACVDVGAELPAAAASSSDILDEQLELSVSILVILLSVLLS
jgi:hypothetical protein